MATAGLLVETLNQLSPEEFKEFKTLVQLETGSVLTSSSRPRAGNMQDVMEQMVKKYRGECVEKTKTIFLKMRRHDLVQRLSATDSRAKDKLAVVEEQPLLDQRIAKMSSDIKLLLETLEELSVHEFTDFKEILSSSVHTWLFFTNRPRRQEMEHLQEMEDLRKMGDLQEMVIFIVQTYGEKSLMVTSNVLENIRRMDLAQRLLSRTSAARGKVIKPGDLEIGCTWFLICVICASICLCTSTCT
ncbi:hypothetical protein AMECASPLE_024424 [Ameca splendens]|uniref:Pyrin domain-containing protein n=1 Tax=Ameca splendens TaxID=208324 RepID=A0ABV0Y4A8_9TELE